MRIHDESPSSAELDAFQDRLNEITAAGGSIKLVQIYTIARRTTEAYVTPLADDEVDAIVARVARATGLKTMGFHGVAVENDSMTEGGALTEHGALTENRAIDSPTAIEADLRNPANRGNEKCGAEDSE
ncbi:MAG: hypothetical protein R3B96_03250 [Pirellulaceae bacterium]